MHRLAAKKKTSFHSALLELLAFVANLPRASSNFGRAFILKTKDQTYVSRRLLSRPVFLSRLRSSLGFPGLVQALRASEFWQTSNTDELGELHFVMHDIFEPELQSL